MYTCMTMVIFYFNIILLILDICYTLTRDVHLCVFSKPCELRPLSFHQEKKYTQIK